jgi:hypothetical protein
MNLPHTFHDGDRFNFIIPKAIFFSGRGDSANRVLVPWYARIQGRSLLKMIVLDPFIRKPCLVGVPDRLSSIPVHSNAPIFERVYYISLLNESSPTL